MRHAEKSLTLKFENLLNWNLTKYLFVRKKGKYFVSLCHCRINVGCNAFSFFEAKLELLLKFK